RFVASSSQPALQIDTPQWRYNAQRWVGETAPPRRTNRRAEDPNSDEHIQEATIDKEEHMDEDAKKKALRMIPYGLFLLTAKNGDDIASGTVNWITQTSFKPPLVAVGIKQDSHPYAVVKASGAFALNALGADQKDIAQTFFGP